MPGMKHRSGRRTKIEENYGRNLGLKGMQLLEKTVDDNSVPDMVKLKLLEPYLTKLIPQLVRVEADGREGEILSLTIARKLLVLLDPATQQENRLDPPRDTVL